MNQLVINTHSTVQVENRKLLLDNKMIDFDSLSSPTYMLR